MKKEKQTSKKGRKKLSLPNLSKYPKLAPFLNALFVLLLFSICLVVSYRYWTHTIGDGAYKYSDDTYQHIEDLIKSCVITDVGIDRLPLQKELTMFVDTFQNKETELFCVIQDGYFKAEITAILSENCSIMSSTRNYNSLQEYMNHYWLDFGLRIFVSTIVSFFLLEAIWFIVTALCSLISKKRASKNHLENSDKEISNLNSSDFEDLNATQTI